MMRIAIAAAIVALASPAIAQVAHKKAPQSGESNIAMICALRRNSENMGKQFQNVLNTIENIGGMGMADIKTASREFNAAITRYERARANLTGPMREYVLASLGISKALSGWSCR